MTDYTLQTLLDMDGEIYFYPSRHWHKISVRQLSMANNNFPHGIKYSLTLHAPNGMRLLGYDNAHSAPADKYHMPYDHIHKGTRIIKYPYKSAAQLLIDFFTDVTAILEFEQEYEYEI